MNTVKNNQKGFTLLEIIVVLAVLGALAAMLAPVVFRYIDDANQARAQADVQTIAAAINQMYKDTGRYPFYKTGTGKLPWASTDASFLSSNPACVGTAGAADTTAPADGAGNAAWTLATALCDSLSNQLIANTPFSGASGTAYLATGPRAWKGPYLERVPALDPWGRSYLVNIANADPADTSPAGVFVLSAGANGTLETDITALLTAGPVAGGDDVVSRVR